MSTPEKPSDVNANNSERRKSLIEEFLERRKSRSKSTDEEGIKTICDIIGNWGPYQSRLFALYIAIYIIAPTQNNGVIFYTDKVDHWCKSPSGFDRSPNASQCMQEIDGVNVACTEWDYDYSEYQGNMVQAYDLVCDRSIYISYVKSIYQVGYLVSSLFFGWFSDKHGRRLALRVSILLELTMSLGQALAPNIELFMISRFFLGIGAYSRFLTGMLILLEWAAPENRARVQILSEFGWTAGKIILPLLYLLIRNFRYTQMTIFIWELLVLYPTWKYYPDSPNWLILKGRFKEAEDALTLASSVNKTGDREYVQGKLELLTRKLKREEKEREAESNKNLFDLLKVPRLLMFSIVVYLMWFSVAFIGYGLSFNMGDLGGSLYVTWFLFEAMGFSKKVLVIAIINRFDRRTLQSSFMLMTAISFYLIIPFTFDDKDFTIRMALAVFGYFWRSSCFDLNYLMTAEIFPTGMRQIGIGSGSVAARIASISAPFTKELTAATNLGTTMALYATLALFASVIVWLLPKTKDKPIPNTMEEAERRKKKKEESVLELNPQVEMAN